MGGLPSAHLMSSAEFEVENLNVAHAASTEARNTAPATAVLTANAPAPDVPYDDSSSTAAATAAAAVASAASAVASAAASALADAYEAALDRRRRERFAAESALLDSCVWKIINDEGHLEDVRRFPFLSWSMHRDLGKYGCSVAVRLLLVVKHEGIVALTLCFLLTLPNLIDNLRRTKYRHDCRFTGVGSGSLMCGVADVALRTSSMMPEQPFYLWTAMGACEEYANTSIVLQPTFTYDNPFVHLRSAAEYCIHPYLEQSYELWSGVLVMVVLTLYLLRLRRLQVRIVRDHNRHTWTPGDYAVLIEGLMCGQVPADQEGSLRSDMRKIGIGDVAISHIEIGCGCKSEFELLQSIAELRVKTQELGARRGRTAEQEKRDQAKLEATREKLAAARLQLSKGREDEHVTTGQAFIVFQSEDDRNKLISRFDPDYALVRPGPAARLAARLEARLAESGFIRQKKEAEEGDDGPIKRAKTRARPRRLLGVKHARVSNTFRDMFQHLNNLFRESEFADLEASDPDRALVVAPAPEPTDVLWQNLEIDDDERFRRTFLTYVITGLIVLMSAASCAFLTTLKHNGPEWIGYGRDDDSWWAWAFSLGLSAATAIGINVANFVIYTYVYAATEHERHISRTLHERSLFTKLSLAYLANTVALPLIVGCVPFGPTQGWYEVGGPVDTAQVILLSGALINELLKVTQPYTWYVRYVRGRFAHSQLRLNALWAPPDMFIGELFADLVKLIALCLLYAPLQPMMYVYTVLALVLSLACDKYAISYWWRAPPSCRADLMERLRFTLWLLLPLHFGASAFALVYAQPREGAADAMGGPLALSIIVWLCYPLALLLSGVLGIEVLQMANSLEPTTTLYGATWRLMGDDEAGHAPTEIANDALAAALAANQLAFTQPELVAFGLRSLPAGCCIRVGGERYLEVAKGVRYDDVPLVLGYGIDRYRGLAATREEETAVAIEERAFRSGLAGLNAKYTAVRRLTSGAGAGADAPVESSAFARALNGTAEEGFRRFEVGVQDWFLGRLVRQEPPVAPTVEAPEPSAQESSAAPELQA